MKKTTRLVEVNLDVEPWERIKQIAASEDRSAVGLLRMFIRQGLEQYESRAREERQRPAA